MVVRSYNTIFCGLKPVHFMSHNSESCPQSLRFATTFKCPKAMTGKALVNSFLRQAAWKYRSWAAVRFPTILYTVRHLYQFSRDFLSSSIRGNYFRHRSISDFTIPWKRSLCASDRTIRWMADRRLQIVVTHMKHYQWMTSKLYTWQEEEPRVPESRRHLRLLSEMGCRAEHQTSQDRKT